MGAGLHHGRETASAEFLFHVLRVMGARGSAWQDGVRILHAPEDLDAAAAAFVAGGGMLVAVCPGAPFLAAVGLAVDALEAAGATFQLPGVAGVRLRSLHGSLRFHPPAGSEVVLRDEAGRAAWVLIPSGAGATLVTGTDIGADILRYRQGDPAAADARPTEAMWDIAGERPVYLFEQQLRGLSRFEERQADWWSDFAVKVLSRHPGLSREPLLPGGAPGAIVITGDDDQAELAKYEEQLGLLGGQPITYFLHPLTRHDRASMARLFDGRQVELGLHPDALEHPDRYSRLLKEQAAWFVRLTGRRAVSVRNHGYLNDGYWGHLAAWSREGLRISSNLPGVDGRPLNGSFLPARLQKGGALTAHWSVVTAIGDGVRYVQGGRSDEAAAACIHECARTIRESGIPGVMVLNLHPQNVADTQAMHRACLEVIQSGFLPWTMEECARWFESWEPSRRSHETGVLRRTWDALVGRRRARAMERS